MPNDLRYIDGLEYDPAKGRFKAWLRTIPLNHMKSHFRVGSGVQPETRLCENNAATGESPEARLDKVWKEEHPAFCLKAIQEEAEPKLHGAIQLYAIEEESPVEVCANLNREPAQLYRIRHKMFQRLGQKMRELLGDEYAEA